MTTREEKLAAARKKLRAYMGQNKDNDHSRARAESDTSSPSPSLNSNDVPRADSPVDIARLAWERRQTLDIEDSRIQDRFKQNLPMVSEVSQRPCSADGILQTERYSSAFENSNDVGYTISPERQLIQQVLSNESQVFMQREAQLQEQLRRQGQAINVIIAERNDAQTALSRVQAQLHEKSGSLEDLKLKYAVAVERIRDLEEKPPHIGPSSSHSPVVEDEKKMEQLYLLQQKNGIMEEQLREFRQKLEGKRAECESLTHDVRQLRNDLSVSDVRIQQLSVNETSVSNIRIEELEAQKEELEGKVSLLERRLQAAAVEGEQAGHRFQMYADQCSTQITALRGQARDLAEENNSTKLLNDHLKKQIADLEKAVVEAQTSGNPLEEKISALVEENSELAKNLTEKEGEIVALQGICTESGEKVVLLQRELEELSENKRMLQAKADVGHADPALLAAMESDKVAASRAVSQNQRLKEQLAELEAAFVRVSNEKLELMDKLSREEHENKELRKQLNSRSDLNHNHDDDDCDHKHDHGHDPNHERDHIFDSDDEKDIDSLRNQVALLRKDKTELITRLQVLSSEGKTYIPPQHHSHDHESHHLLGHRGHEHAHGNSHELDHNHSEECDHDHEKKEKSTVTSEEVEELRRVVQQLQEDKSELLRRLGAPSEDPQVQGLLEEKLRKTMDEIAALDEEKQRLEHLVLQLQGETETIGEYISLYHKQRMLLRKRSLEKDEQLQQLTRDREDLREKLASLNDLVDKLVESGSDVASALPGNGVEEATADRIRALITEIGNNNVVNAQHHGIEHCFCCSGQLQTV